MLSHIFTQGVHRPRARKDSKQTASGADATATPSLSASRMHRVGERREGRAGTALLRQTAIERRSSSTMWPRSTSQTEAIWPGCRRVEISSSPRRSKTSLPSLTR